MAAKTGAFPRERQGYAPQQVARGGVGGSPAKRLHYHHNGTGRDTYIATNNGGFMTNYGFKKDYDSYIENLRGYHNNAPMKEIQKSSNNQQRASPKKDHFVEGQLSIRSPKVRNGLAMLNSYQRGQCARLSMPRQRSLEHIELVGQTISSRPSLMKDTSNSRFLRKSGQFMTI